MSYCLCFYILLLVKNSSNIIGYCQLLSSVFLLAYRFQCYEEKSSTLNNKQLMYYLKNTSI